MNTLKIVVFGERGRLGSALVKRGAIPAEADITDGDQVRETLKKLDPDFIINCAAVTDVDLCEFSDETNKRAITVAVKGNSNIMACSAVPLIYISTDYVFSGKHGPYSESDRPDPINRYGFSKLAGEAMILGVNRPRDLVVRISVPFGGDKENDFTQKVIRQLEKGDPFYVPAYISGSPYSVDAIVYSLGELISILGNPTREQEKLLKYHIIHISNGVYTRYDFARMIAEVFYPELRKLILPLKDGYKPGETITVAPRPKRAGLRNQIMNKLKMKKFDIYNSLVVLRDQIHE